MHDARSFFTVLLLAGTLAGVSPAIAAEGTSPPSGTSYEVNVLRQVAAALAAGNHAIQDLRGPPIDNSNLDRLNVPTPGMDCGIARTPYVCRMPQRFVQQRRRRGYVRSNDGLWAGWLVFRWLETG